METLWTEIQNTFNYTALSRRLLDWTPNLVSAILILVAAWLLWRIYRRGMAIILGRAGMDATIQTLIHSSGKIVIFSIALVSAMGQVGVDVTGLLTGLGVAGLTIGFAARDALSNMISGFFILWDRPFTIGDLVDIGGAYGRVDAITLRTTRVVTPDGRMLAIPNTEIINKTVASYTNFPHLRLEIPFTVGVNEDISSVRSTALSICRDDNRLLADPAPAVVVTALNDYNVELELRTWINDERSHMSARFDLREKLFETLRTAGVDMPYETISLTPLELGTSARTVLAQ